MATFKVYGNINESIKADVVELDSTSGAPVAVFKNLASMARVTVAIIPLTDGTYVVKEDAEQK